MQPRCFHVRAKREVGASAHCGNRAGAGSQIGWAARAKAATAPTQPAPNTNPSDAPYPVWSATEDYPAGYKVVFHGLGYVVKWDNQGVTPANSTSNASGSPWRLLYQIPGEPTS